MLLLFSIKVDEWSSVCKESCSFGLPCVSFVDVYQSVCVCASFPFGFEDVMSDLIVLVSDHCLLFTLDSLTVSVLFSFWLSKSILRVYERIKLCLWVCFHTFRHFFSNRNNFCDYLYAYPSK